MADGPLKDFKDALSGVEKAENEWKVKLILTVKELAENVALQSKRIAELHSLLISNTDFRPAVRKVIPVDGRCPSCLKIKPLKLRHWRYDKENDRTICLACAGFDANSYIKEWRKKKKDELIPLDRKCPYCLKVRERFVLISEKYRINDLKIGCRPCISSIQRFYNSVSKEINISLHDKEKLLEELRK